MLKVHIQVAVLLFQPKYRLSHPENYLFSSSNKIFSGSKYPKNILFNFEKRSTDSYDWWGSKEAAISEWRACMMQWIAVILSYNVNDFFGILWSYKKYFTNKITCFRGDVTDTSAETKSLVVSVPDFESKSRGFDSHHDWDALKIVIFKVPDT